MYDRNSSLDETASFLLPYPPQQIVLITYVMCENLLLRAKNNCFALGVSDRPYALTPEEINEFEAGLTPHKRKEIAASILSDIEEINKILRAAGMAINMQEENKKQNSKGEL